MRYPNSELYSPVMTKNFHTIIAVDLETTGLDAWRNEILTWSMSALDYRTLERKDSIELTFRPKNLNFWGAGAEAVHGISISQALYFDDKEVSTNRAIEFISDHCKGVPQTLICHAFDKYKTLNIFDVTMIMGHMEKMGKRAEFYRHLRFFESTETYFREARRRGYYRSGGDLFTFSENDEHNEGKDFKLDTLCKHYRIPLKHHDARSDREACEQLYRIARSLGDDEERNTNDFNLQRESYGEGGGSEESN